jgi:phosphohistidine phosphatase
VTSHTLVLVRHAKSADGPVDSERPLSDRGRHDAEAIGRFLAQAAIAPDRVVVSPARRARQTWKVAQSELGEVVPLTIDGRIYDNEVAALLETIRDTPASVQTLVLVGHNPSFASLAQTLDDTTGDPGARRELLAGYPTSAVAIFDLPGSWADVAVQSATLRAFAVPRAS